MSGLVGLSIEAVMSVLLSIPTAKAFDDISPVWGWVVLIVWVNYQLYWPFWETKVQQFHNDLTTRLRRIEITQVALSEEVSGVDSESVKDIHGHESLSASDLKNESLELGET